MVRSQIYDVLSKTYFMPICSGPNPLAKYNKLQLDGNHNIFLTSKIKYLGIIIDAHIKWENQINFLVKKIAFLSYRFKTKEILNTKSLVKLYLSLVQSHLVYRLLAWGRVGKLY